MNKAQSEISVILLPQFDGKDPGWVAPGLFNALVVPGSWFLVADLNLNGSPSSLPKLHTHSILETEGHVIESV